MNIDDRIQALTQSLELLASLHKDLEIKTAAGFEQTRRNFEIVLDSIKSLENIATAT